MTDNISIALFNTLFKKYRLRSEIESLSEFADLMAEKKYIYEESLFSRWQNGTRIPKERKILLAMLEIFIYKEGLKTVDEANALFEAAGQGYLTVNELQSLPSNLLSSSPFLVPQKVKNVIIRKQLFENALRIINNNNILLLTGVAGVGKTTMAIELGYKLKSQYPDGILWFRLDNKNSTNVLYSMAHIFKYRFDHIDDKQTLSSFIRSILYSKKILYIFDNAETCKDLNLLLPSSPTSFSIITSKSKNYSFIENNQILQVPEFSKEESKQLFDLLLTKDYVLKNASDLEIIAQLIGYLPLAVQIAAKLLSLRHYSPDNFIEYVKNSNIVLDECAYENTTLMKSLDLSYKKLSTVEKRVLICMSIFAGADFSLEAVAHILSIDITEIRQKALILTQYSLLEQSTNDRYRLHPVIKKYLERKKTPDNLYEKATEYYSDFLNIHKKKFQHKLIIAEIDTIADILNYLIEHDLYISIILLFKEFGVILWNVGQWSLLKKYLSHYCISLRKTNNLPEKSFAYAGLCSWWEYWSGNISKAEKYTQEALQIAMDIDSPYHIFFAKERLGKIYISKEKFVESETLLNEALHYFISNNNIERIANTYRYLGENYLSRGKIDAAYNALQKTLIYFKNDANWSSIQYKYIIESIVYANLGLVYFLQNKTIVAKELFLKSLDLQKAVNNISIIGVLTNIIIALSYEELGQKTEAKIYFREAEDGLLLCSTIKNLSKTSIYFRLLKKNLKQSIMLKGYSSLLLLLK